jgi:hypothetical protein
MKAVYPSRYSPTAKVHAAQYITELICENKAKKEKKELPIRFWKLQEWQKFYRYQIMLANQLIKEYDESCIIGALMDKRCWWVVSLRTKFLTKIIEEKREEKSIQEKVRTKIEYNFEEKKVFDSNNSKKSIISKLKDLE